MTEFQPRCEMCRARESRWHQQRPVERWLCLECAQSDSRSCPTAWVGELFPIGTHGELAPRNADEAAEQMDNGRNTGGR